MNETMTVGQLIEALMRFSLDLPVYTEGCDCHGTALDVKEENFTGEPVVMIYREKSA